MTYAELVALLDGDTGYVHRGDQTTKIATFITLAHARIMRDVRDPSMVSRYTQTLAADTRYITLPTAARKLLDVQTSISGGRQSALPMSATQMNTYHSAVVVQDPTRNYVLRGRTMEFQPTVPSGATLELLTLDRLDHPLAAGNDLLTNSPNIYVYASMMEFCVSANADERLPVFTAAYKAEVEGLNEEYDEWELSGGPLQILNLGVSTP